MLAHPNVAKMNENTIPILSLIQNDRIK